MEGGKPLRLNASIPRIVRRYEEAFEELGLAFHKTPTARLFLRESRRRLIRLCLTASREKFERLLKVIGSGSRSCLRARPRRFGETLRCCAHRLSSLC